MALGEHFCSFFGKHIMLKNVSFTVALLCTTPALALSPGYEDYVTATQGGHGYPQCLQVQTANAGGDSGSHIWRPCAETDPPPPGTVMCFGIGTGVAGATQNDGFVPPERAGVNGVGPVVATSILSMLNASRYGGGPAGPWLKFVVQPRGFFGDCPTNYFGMDQVSQ